jgi:hypothetical protein
MVTMLILDTNSTQWGYKSRSDTWKKSQNEIFFITSRCICIIYIYRHRAMDKENFDFPLENRALCKSENVTVFLLPSDTYPSNTYVQRVHVKIWHVHNGVYSTNVCMPFYPISILSKMFEFKQKGTEFLGCVFKRQNIFSTKVQRWMESSMIFMYVLKMYFIFVKHCF